VITTSLAIFQRRGDIDFGLEIASRRTGVRNDAREKLTKACTSGFMVEISNMR
jgi:hypothetical protein